jgi:hypothetical protein
VSLLTAGTAPFDFAGFFAALWRGNRWRAMLVDELENLVSILIHEAIRLFAQLLSISNCSPVEAMDHMIECVVRKNEIGTVFPK